MVDVALFLEDHSRVGSAVVAGGERRPFAVRGLGHGIPGIRVDGNDFLAVYAVTEWAAQRARQGGGPSLIELVTYRAAAHSTSDDPSRYRPRDEAQAWPLGDPINRLKQHMITEGIWSEARHEKLIGELEEHCANAWQEALSYGTMTTGPQLDQHELFDDVLKDIPAHLLAQRDELRSLGD